MSQRIRPVCAGPECTRTLDPVQNTSGLCRSHYKQRHLGKPLTPLRVATKDLGRPAVCSFPGCDRPHKARGYCKSHNEQIKSGKPLAAVEFRRPPGPCSVEGCDRDRLANDLCARHNSNRVQRWRMYGMTAQQGAEMWEAQGQSCASCRTPAPIGSLTIDHDHSCCPRGSCGKCVRGLICQPCNLAAGHAKDDPARLRALADYLERTKLTG